jgi:hypothetical protein
MASNVFYINYLTSLMQRSQSQEISDRTKRTTDSDRIDDASDEEE